jgi:hypothetical protein
MTDTRTNSERIRDYAAGRLSDSDTRAFEAELLVNSALVKDLEDSLRLREGLEVLRDRGELDPQLKPRRQWALQWSLAAAAAVIAGIGILLWMNSPGGRVAAVASTLEALGRPHGERLSVVARYPFAAMRHESALLVLVLPPRGALELRVLPGSPAPAQSYRVEVDEILTEPHSIGVVTGLLRDSTGFVTIYADASRLHVGRYALRITPEGETNPSEERIEWRFDAAPAVTPRTLP